MRPVEVEVPCVQPGGSTGYCGLSHWLVSMTTFLKYSWPELGETLCSHPAGSPPGSTAAGNSGAVLLSLSAFARAGAAAAAFSRFSSGLSAKVRTSATDDSRAWVGDWSRKLARRSGVPALCSLPGLLLVRNALRRGLTARGVVVAAFGGVWGLCESSVPRDRKMTGDWSDHWSDWALASGAYGCILEPLSRSRRRRQGRRQGRRRLPPLLLQQQLAPHVAAALRASWYYTLSANGRAQAVRAVAYYSSTQHQRACTTLSSVRRPIPTHQHRRRRPCALGVGSLGPCEHVSTVKA